MSKDHARRAGCCLLAPALAFGLVLGGCCRPYGACRRAPVTSTAPVTPAGSTLTAEQRVAVGWIRRAHAAEPEVTGRLQAIAQAESATLGGLEHKLKSLASTVSKLERLHAQSPATPLEDIEIYDALRYTMIVPDAPPGRHEAAIRGALEALERLGYGIRKVKNYWPCGDSYSGTNCLITTVAGFPWELQVHTPESYATKDSTHEGYERMRNPGTPLEERRRLFEEMTEVWESVPVPCGILVPGSLHAREEILLLPTP